MTGPRYPDLIAKLPSTVPFVGPETQERALQRPFRARLGANENAFGPSPKAIAAMQNACTEVWQYADPEHFELKNAVVAKLGIGVQNIVFGEGIDALLGYIVRLLVSPGDCVVTSEGAYPTFNYHVNAFGGVLHTVPYRDDHEDLAALCKKAAEVDAKIVYLANPDNPMGTWHTGAEIKAAMAHLPYGTLLALDEAYIEFAPEGTSVDLPIEDPRLIRFRTFSKGYGMAGARVGYAIGAQSLITAFDKIRNHFSMNRTAQAAATAAVQDQAWLDVVIAKVADSKRRIADIASDNGLTTLASATNFVTVDCGKDGNFARAVLQALIDDGIFVRMPFVAPQNRCIRISAGTKADMDLFADALPKALKAARQNLTDP